MEISSPGKVIFPAHGYTKNDLANYYLTVAPALMSFCQERPAILKRYPRGVDNDFFFQKHLPNNLPSWLRTIKVTFPSERTADLLLLHDIDHVIWSINLGCIDVHTWAVDGQDTDHPNELRIDLDPTHDVPFNDVAAAATLFKETLKSYQLEGTPKTSGSRGMHIIVNIEPNWEFIDVRRAGIALARQAERTAPDLITTAWWKEERKGVFVDYNQNARDRALASAYSVRPVADALVSYPLSWDEVLTANPADYRIDTVPELIAKRNKAIEKYQVASGRLDKLLQQADEDERQGLEDLPWPPHYPKGATEPKRVQPSKANKKVMEI